mmetsp:Transcript_2710/g.3166  ORF Transcript_2710/g.3166 Transcript_2710/m.3166 type:complete len:440 (-) Transcript_2710:382-1701(-)
MVDKQLNRQDVNLKFLVEDDEQKFTYSDIFIIQRELFTLWISQMGKERILNHVQKLQTVLAINILAGGDNQNLGGNGNNFQYFNCLNSIDLYSEGNNKNAKEEQIKYTEFYNDLINKEIELASHYEKWVRGLNYCKKKNIKYDRHSPNGSFTLCNYPWLLDTTSKGEIIKYEAKAQMELLKDQELANLFIMGLTSQLPQNSINEIAYLKFDVRREFIVEDTLNNLIREGVNLKKQLKVNFKGEFGQDEGGVQKEYFQILVRDLFKPEFTMFNYHQESKYVWFNGDTYESNIKFELIGALMGLAIYNGIILDIHYPLACYKKLLDLEPTIEDLKEMIPSTGNSLQYILNCQSETLEQDLYLSFIYEYEVFGENKLEELKENGANIYVNQDNKHEYVELMLEFIFNKSIENQFTAFYRGFHKACGGDALNLFRPEELQGLI